MRGWSVDIQWRKSGLWLWRESELEEVAQPPSAVSSVVSPSD